MRTVVLIFFCLVCTATVRSEETHLIKLKYELDVGKTASYRSVDSSSGVIQGFDANDKKLFERKKEGGETSYRLTVLERNKEGEATRFLRVYDKAMEKEDGKVTNFSFQGRTILFEKAGGKFRIGVAGEPPLDPKDVTKLLKEVNKKSTSNSLLGNLAPDKPVKVGETWALPVKKLIESFDGMKADESKSRVTAKLVKVYSKGKSKFGTLDVQMKLRVTGMAEDGQTMTFDPPASFDGNIVIDTAIDGSSIERTEGGSIAMKGESRMTIGEATVRMVLDMKGSGKDSLSPGSDDPIARNVPKVKFAADPNEWIAFKSKNGIFAAKFPGVPKETSKKAEGYTETRWVAEADRGQLAYGVVVTEFANPNFIDPPTVRKSVVARFKDARDIKEIKTDGVAGTEFKHDQKQGAITLEITRRIFVLPERAFEVMAVAPKGRKADDEKFFKSFQILSRPKDD